MESSNSSLITTVQGECPLLLGCDRRLRRSRWSYIRSVSKASVVPLRHDEHPRFIVGAWPFYTAPVSISIAFLLFCGLWVMLAEEDRTGKKKAE